MNRVFQRIPFVSLLIAVVLALVSTVSLVWAQASSTSFTYQGQLFQNGDAVGADAAVDCAFQFNLYDAESGGNLLGTHTEGDPTTSSYPVTVTDGYFTVELDFGTSAFTDDGVRYLAISTACTGENSFTSLSGRVALTGAPYTRAVAFGAIFDRPANVIEVATSGGDFQTIGDALTAVSNGNDSDGYSDASDSNRYLVRVAPGTYDEQVDLVSYVTIEGAGETQTFITQDGSDSHSASSATIIAESVSETEMRDLTIIADASSSSSTDIRALHTWNAFVTLTHVTIEATAGSNSTYVIYSNATTNDASAGKMTFRDSSVSASSSNGGDVISFFVDDGSVYVANTLVEGTPYVRDSNDVLACVNAFDATYTALNSTCQ